MRGTGTEQYPYMIMSIDDIYSIESFSGEDIYFELCTDIDFNDSIYAENFRPIKIDCKNFNGNNHVIRNINYVTPEGNASIFVVSGENENITIENLIMENIRLSGKNAFVFGNDGGEYNISIRHCTFTLNDITITANNFSGIYKGYCMLHDDDIQADYEYCTFAVKSRSPKVTPIFSKDTIGFTQVRAEIFTNDFSITDNKYNAVISDSDVYDSCFFLKIDTSVSLGSPVADFSSRGCTFSHSYLVCEPAGILTNIYWYGSITSTCFYDMQVFKKNNSDVYMRCSNGNSANIFALTTEQCKNAEYLRSVGFNCAGAEE